VNKVLFLDVDGPLIPARALFLPGNLRPTLQGQWAFDPCAVGMLNFLAWAVPDLVGVISSHRVGLASPRGYEGHSTFERAFWERVLADNGLKIQLHHDWITPRRVTRHPKLQEIGQWLAAHPEITEFAVIEDDFNGNGSHPTPEQVDQFHIVATDYLQGLSYPCLTSLARKFGLPATRLPNLYHAFIASNGGQP